MFRIRNMPFMLKSVLSFVFIPFLFIFGLNKNSMCQSITLTTKGNTCVSYCRKCQYHYVWQKSYVLTFSGSQFAYFLDEIKLKIGKEEFLSFPDDEERMFLPTPAAEILFTFTKEEWRDFTTALQEANYMREVYQLIQ